jgi:adenosine deaminase
MRSLARILVCLALVATACTPSPKTQSSAGEIRTARALLSYESQGPLELHAFLEQFPKGADLHVHLSGAVYAETFIKDAAEDGLCVDPAGLKFAKPPCRGKAMPAAALLGDMTPANQDLYDRLIDAFSMRSFVPTTGFSGHDQFFATFARFGGLDKRHVGEWVDEVASRADAQNQQYLELMDTPSFGDAATIAHALGWKAGDPDFATIRKQLLDRGLRDEVGAGRDDVRQAASWSAAERNRQRRRAQLRSGISTRCCAAIRRSRCLRRRCWGLRRLRPAWMRMTTPGWALIL